jgi:hypothetical protein
MLPPLLAAVALCAPACDAASAGERQQAASTPGPPALAPTPSAGLAASASLRTDACARHRSVVADQAQAEWALR